MPRVVFVCVHNAGRSQIAEAMFNQLAPAPLRAASAGTEPAAQVNPVVAQALSEIGLDISGRTPQLLTPELLGDRPLVVTMGCGVDRRCPALLGVRVDEDWDLPDPSGQPLEVVRSLRDQIRVRVEELIRRLSHGGV